SGALSVTDVDQGQANFTAQAATAGSKERKSTRLNSGGHVTYNANNNQPTIQQLGASDSITDSFTAVSSDGSASQIVTVTIHGTNDTALISCASTGHRTQHSLPTRRSSDLSGALSVTDVDQGQANFTAQAATAGS